MKILITAATQSELDGATAGWCEGSEKKHNIDILITGIGSVATAYNVTKALLRHSYDLAINIGIAGSFSEQYPIGSVAVIENDCFADLGVYENDCFKSVFSMGLLSDNEKPFTDGSLQCPYVDRFTSNQRLPKAKAATVNTVTGSVEKAEELRRAYAPHVESMEGAAFFYVCLCQNTPFLQIRSISNMVGVRDKAQWDIALAIENLGKNLNSLLHAI